MIKKTFDLIILTPFNAAVETAQTPEDIESFHKILIVNDQLAKHNETIFDLFNTVNVNSHQEALLIRAIDLVNAQAFEISSRMVKSIADKSIFQIDDCFDRDFVRVVDLHLKLLGVALILVFQISESYVECIENE